MGVLYPPILDSQRESIAAGPRGGGLKIYFTMPQSTVPEEIGHVQVLIRKILTHDPWSKQVRSVSVPEKETIYLQGPDKTAPAPHSEALYQKIADDLWELTVPQEVLRGHASVGNGDMGEGGFSSGIKQQGETYSIQIRFGEAELTYTTVEEFGAWKREQISNRGFGEWSNTQKMFVYEKPENGFIFDARSLRGVTHKVAWSYKPLSNDPITRITVAYTWDIERGSGKEYRLKELPVKMSNSLTAEASGVFDSTILTAVDVHFLFTAVTANNSIFTVQSTRDSDLGKKIEDWAWDQTSSTTCIGGVRGAGEELEDGKLTVSWSTQTYENAYQERLDFYRVNAQTWETIFLRSESVYFSGASAQGSFDDFVVEMGEKYWYLAAKYSADGSEWRETSMGTPWERIKDGEIRECANTNFYGNSFLLDGSRQLRLAGNTIISRYQRNTSDSFTRTIGSKYPFYNRSAKTNYRTYSVQSLVSIEFDPTNTFFSYPFWKAAPWSLREAYLSGGYEGVEKERFLRGREDIHGELIDNEKELPFWAYSPLKVIEGEEGEGRTILLPEQWIRTDTAFSRGRRRTRIGTPDLQGAALVETFGEGHLAGGPLTQHTDIPEVEITTLRDSGNSDDKIYGERRFREEVLDWLTDGKVKVFKTETEGNIMVMVSDVSMSPLNGTRLVYTVSMTLTEIDEYSDEALKRYKILPSKISSSYISNMFGVRTPINYVQGGFNEFKVEDLRYYPGKQYKKGDIAVHRVIRNGKETSREFFAKKDVPINTPAKAEENVYDPYWGLTDFRREALPWYS